MPSAAELQPTESLDNGLAMETLVSPAYPMGKHHVQVVHNFDKISLAKLVVVIVPTSHLALNLYCYLLEFPAKMGIFSISQMHSVSLEDAMDIFYNSPLLPLLEEGAADLHRRSAKYLAEEIRTEQGQGPGP